jgi:nitroreductase
MDNSIFFRRKSKRSYLGTPIPKEKLDRIIEIVRWAPSCNNNQPWRFIFVSEPKQKEKFVSALPQGNSWAATAPMLIAVCGRPADDYNREDDPVQYHQFDCGLAVMSLLLGAVEEGLMGHAMAGYDAKKVKEALDIPAEYHVLCVIALGYEGPIDLLNDQNRKKDEFPRTRKGVNEIIAFDRFKFQ